MSRAIVGYVAFAMPAAFQRLSRRARRSSSLPAETDADFPAKGVRLLLLHSPLSLQLLRRNTSTVTWTCLQRARGRMLPLSVSAMQSSVSSAGVAACRFDGFDAALENASADIASAEADLRQALLAGSQGSQRSTQARQQLRWDRNACAMRQCKTALCVHTHIGCGHP